MTSFVPMKDLLAKADKGGYAVPGFCTWNAETIFTTLKTATRMKAPVILMSGPMEFHLFSPAELGAIANRIIQDFKIPTALHLDHGDTIKRVEECLESGYSSVMLDYSRKPYKENADALKQVYRLAHPKGITVEGEIGHVGAAGTTAVEGFGVSSLTEPEEAARYAVETGVDALAVSIGNAHGEYTRLPKLDFGRLAEIKKTVKVPLVLHGGSGTPDDDLRKAIELGIRKVNVATELAVAYRTTIMTKWGENKNTWPPIVLNEATQAMEKVVEKWIRLTGAEGKA